MPLRFEPFVGLRYLMAKRQRNVLSVITLISVGGVAVGVMALIVVLSVMGGFEGDLREKIIGAKAHIVVSAESGFVADYNELIEQIEGVEGVTGAAPFVEAEVMINSPANLQGVILRGIDTARIDRVSNIGDAMEEGALRYLDDPDSFPANERAPFIMNDDGLIIHRDGDRPLSPDELGDLKASGAKASIAFVGAEHGDWMRTVVGSSPPPSREQPKRLPPLDAPTKPDGADATLDGADGTPAADAAALDAKPSSDASPSADAKPADPVPALEADVWLEPRPSVASSDGSDDRPARATIEPLAHKPKRVMGAIPGLGDDAGPRRVGGLVIGRELKTNLASALGYEVNVMSPTGDVGPTGGLPKSRPFKIVGVFYSGMYEYDTKMAYMSLGEAQRLLNIGPRVSGIEVRVESIEESGEVKARIEALLGEDSGLQVQDWRELNGNLFSALLLEKIAMFVILTSIILVASFNILCLLIMIVIEKGREVAILKAMGAGRLSVMRIFVVQGGVIGLLGTTIGAVVGLLLCFVIASGSIPMPADVYYLSHIPVEVRPLEVLLICGAAIGISLVATIPPSVMAARLDPVEGLRYE